ncbi:hypothetical protein DFH08DRAFT_797580 [Mycena albidolilacea]|uniref:Uncharacterized protein n=1 Tax=Mycena albidolilacea TaxID=1033008 RepID=A0AAD7F4P0_9AGAR|nr:hypothetical protein DFH08DRAFT_797580 [Mycena albidolilacea]
MKTSCGPNAGNTILYCYPMVDTIAVQDAFTAFVCTPKCVTAASVYIMLTTRKLGNMTFVNLVGVATLNIYLFHADSQQQIFWFSNVINPVSQAGGSWTGGNTSFPFFWILTPSNVLLDDGVAKPQATLQAVSSYVTRDDIAVLSSCDSNRVSHNFYQVDPLPYEGHTPHRLKAALNAEMRAVQAHLHNLRTPSAGSPTKEGGRNLELHLQIAVLTAEVERLQAIGAEEPPPYSL